MVTGVGREIKKIGGVMKLRKRIKHDITIKPSANNGFIVEMGRVKLAYSDHHQMCWELAEYLSNPEKFEKMYPSERSNIANAFYGSGLANGLYNPYRDIS